MRYRFSLITTVGLIIIGFLLGGYISTYSPAIRDVVVAYLPSPISSRTVSIKTGESKPTNKTSDEIKGLGYSSTARIDHNNKGVVHHDTPSSPGSIFYTSLNQGRYSGYLIDKSGTIKHKWTNDDKHGLKPSPHQRLRQKQRDGWRRGFVYPNGDLLIIKEYAGLVKMDKNSDLLWKKSNNAHHDLDRYKGGFYVIKADIAKVKSNDYLVDHIIKITDDGTVKKDINIVKAIGKSKYSGLLRLVNNSSEFDLLHLNTVVAINSKDARRIDHPAFKAGNLIITSKKINAIMVLNPNKEKVIWAKLGLMNLGHENTITHAGQLLLFDNFWNEKRSRVIKYDPATDRITWTYTGREVDQFFSSCCGALAETVHNNVLIGEKGSGRILEIHPQNGLVWQYNNPNVMQDGTPSAIYGVEYYKPDYFNFLEKR